MKNILIFGNSGSGKSTLAKKISKKHNIAHLDLDTIAWQKTVPPQRMPIEESEKVINDYMQAHENWVVEGCYADLLQLLLPKANKVIFLNLSVESCIENAKSRPWEPHKYKTKAEQDSNLNMLIDWITQYPERDDVFSFKAHNALYNAFQGTKIKQTTNL